MHQKQQHFEISSDPKQDGIKPEVRQRQTRETTQCRFFKSGIIQKNQDIKGGTKGSNRTGMPDRLKSGLENLSGYDLSSVKVHYNSPKPRQIGALAYTQGTNIHIGPGQQKHLPHEGWHAVQQMQGRVNPTLQAKGVSINDNLALEREADIMGEKATTQKCPNSLPALQWKNVTNKAELKSPSAQQCAVHTNIVQRALGLEFETGWQIFHELPSKNPGEPPLEISYKKEESIFGDRQGVQGWSMETDGKDIEFVIEPPFAESVAGMSTLNNVMGTLSAFTTLLSAKQNTARLMPATHPQFFQTADPNAVIVPNGDVLKAQPQATVGVRLDRIDDLFREMGREGDTSDLSSRQGTTFFANRAIAAANNAANAAAVNGVPASDKLKGFLTLLSQYIKQGEAEGQRAYAKDIAYAMARTDFASMFALLPEQIYFSANSAEWVTYVLNNAGFPGTGGSLLINQRIADGQDVPSMTYEERNSLPKLPLTRGQWLHQISQGRDMLTQAETTNALAYRDIKGGNRVRAMGLLGGATDNVGGNNLEGVIMELRQMKRAIPATEWHQVARGLLTYLIALNDNNTNKVNAGLVQYARL